MRRCTLRLLEDGSFGYLPGKEFYSIGTDTFRYRAYDGNVLSKAAPYVTLTAAKALEAAEAPAQAVDGGAALTRAEMQTIVNEVMRRCCAGPRSWIWTAVSRSSSAM